MTMLKLVHDRNCIDTDPVVLPPAGGELALLPGPVLWVSADGRVVAANMAAVELMLDIGDAAIPLRDAIVGVLADGAARQAQVTLKGRRFLFQVAPVAPTAAPDAACAIAIGQAFDGAG
jgi:transcriptional regulator of aromatic amino acid metabolism